MPVDYQPAIDWIDGFITERPGTLVVAFLLVTGVFAVGAGNVSTTAGTQQFTEDSPAQAALDEVNAEFTPTFATDTGSTQLIQRGGNVLSRPAMARMLELQRRMADRRGMRVASTTSAAGIVARRLDPKAVTLSDQQRAIEGATDAELERAIRQADETNPRFSSLLSKDFNRESASASATIGVVTHEIPGGISGSAGQGGSSPLVPIQTEAAAIAESVGGDITVSAPGSSARSSPPSSTTPSRSSSPRRCCSSPCFSPSPTGTSPTSCSASSRC